MRLIARADDELYGLASVATKLGRIDKLLVRLGEVARSSPDDAGATFTHALAEMAMLTGSAAGLDTHARFTGLIERYGRVLASEPGHWLARYSRARLRALIPSSYGMIADQPSGELSAAAAELAELLDRQAAVEWQPYFASSHALAAVVGYLSGDHAGSAAQLDRLLACPPARSGLPALGALLCEPLVTLHATSAEPDRTRLRELAAVLYGDQPAVIRMVQRQPAASMP